MHGLLRVRSSARTTSTSSARRSVRDELSRAFEPRPPPVRRVRLRATVQARHPPDKGSATDEPGTRPRPSSPRRSTRPASPMSSIRAEGRSTARRPTSSSRTRSAASWQVHHAAGLPGCPTGSSSSTGRRRRRQAAGGHPPGDLRPLERFFGIFLEHFAGAFPLWLGAGAGGRHPGRGPPGRRRPASSRTTCAAGLRVEVDDSGGRMQNKIRLAQVQKMPYMLVVGEREVEARTASPRTRSGEQQPAEAWEALADRLAQARPPSAARSRGPNREGGTRCRSSWTAMTFPG